MGLLDDAIRQHLELKRQHGAPEEELQRQEEEALGPARREVAPAEPSGGDGEVELEASDEVAAAEAASEQETELFDADAAEERVLEGPEGTLDEPESVLDEPETALDEPETALDEPETALDRPDEEPESEAEPEGVPEPENMPPSPAPFDPDSAFEGFSEREAPDEEEEPEDRHEPDRDEPDVLEDTPDFLQETPEHDRLWFEQKPPRDFDFD
jgi:hypothetical protein